MIKLEEYENIYLNETFLEDFFKKHDIKEKSVGLGYSNKEKKWYGWSHRAMYGFGVGDEIRKGSCGYDDMIKICPDGIIKDEEQCKQVAQAFAKAVD